MTAILIAAVIQSGRTSATNPCLHFVPNMLRCLLCKLVGPRLTGLALFRLVLLDTFHNKGYFGDAFVKFSLFGVMNLNSTNSIRERGKTWEFKDSFSLLVNTGGYINALSVQNFQITMPQKMF